MRERFVNGSCIRGQIKVVSAVPPVFWLFEPKVNQQQYQKLTVQNYTLGKIRVDKFNKPLWY